MFRPRFYRWLAIPVSILAGLAELIALHKCRRHQALPGHAQEKVCHT